MTRPLHVPVLIVGGGPVGLALAIELALRGVGTLLVERRDGSIPLPKMNGVNARTMEFCRRWGIADRVRAAGWPQDYPRRMQYLMNLRSEPFHVIDYGAHIKPSAHSPEHFQRCPQTWFDPLLREVAGGFASNALRYRTQMTAFEDRGDHVTARLVDRESGLETALTADWLVGCDGARSGVREALGIPMTGNPRLSFEINIYFECELERMFRPGERPSTLSWLIRPSGMWGGLSAIDGRRLWRLWLSQMSPDTDIETFDAARWVRDAIGEDVPFRIVGKLPWLRQQRVADAFGQGRVFLCGDAVHNLTPTGGFGMNTGIQDAVDLAWKLAAVQAGWAPTALLDSYVEERRPVAVRNVDEATLTFSKLLALPHLAALGAPGPQGAQAAEMMHRHIVDHDLEREFRNEGIVLGYRYDPSSIVVPDGTPAPDDSPMRYLPNARPGSRAPHAWLAPGRSTLDLFGRDWVLLQLADDAETAPIASALAARRIPLTVEPLRDPAVLALYAAPLVLVRPDGHVAWRGPSPPTDPGQLADAVRGAARTR